MTDEQALEVVIVIKREMSQIQQLCTDIQTHTEHLREWVESKQPK